MGTGILGFGMIDVVDMLIVAGPRKPSLKLRNRQILLKILSKYSMVSFAQVLQDLRS